MNSDGSVHAKKTWKNPTETVRATWYGVFQRRAARAPITTTANV